VIQKALHSGWRQKRRPKLIWSSACAVVACIVAFGSLRPTDSILARAAELSLDPAIASTTRLALDDAALRTGIARDQLEVVTAEAVLWPNGSFGCPQDDTSYTQAPVRGFRIRIQAGDQLLDYHAGVGGKPFYCPRGWAVDPLPERLLTAPANPDTDRVIE
jgi:hypothetical protein